MKKLIQRILFGTPVPGESFDLTVGKPRVQSTCEPAEKLSFNEVFQNVHRELQAADAERLGITK
jgi:hypothetical protein